MFNAALIVGAAAITLSPIGKWLLGYPVPVDLLASGWVIATFAATGSHVGLAIGAGAVFLTSLALRGFRYLFGYKRVAADGDESMLGCAKAAIKQAWHKAKSIFMFWRKPDPTYVPPKWTTVEYDGAATPLVAKAKGMMPKLRRVEPVPASA